MLTTVADMARGAGRTAALLLVASVLTVCVARPASAQRVTSPEVVKCYNGAQKLVVAKPPRNREALAMIRNCLSGKRTKDEQAILYRFAAQLEVEVGNFRQAIRDIEASMATGKLTDVEKAENYYFLGRLYLGVEPPNYAKAIENLRKFLQVAKNPAADAYFYLGQALAMQGKYREAIPNAKKAIELSKKPKENHYRLLLFCYSELRDYRQVVSLVERMLTMFPVKDEYLSQLAAGYQELGREKDAFYVQAFRYELGFLDTESELVGMADLYLLYDYPYHAARILEKEMNAGRVKRTQKNLEKLGNMYFLAREYDKARVYLTRAAVLSPKGILDFRIAQTYFENENWKMAEKHFRLALNKGGLDQPCQARVMLGHTLHSEDRPEAAIEEFRRATEAKACRKEAEQWVTYLTLQLKLDKNAKTYRVLKNVMNGLNTANAAVGDDETASAVAEEALEAAKAALNADSEALRRQKLGEYERARESVERHFKDGAMEHAKGDLEAAQKIVEEARAFDLKGNEKKLVDDLEETANNRVKALEKAQEKMQEADKVAKQARAKQ